MKLLELTLSLWEELEEFLEKEAHKDRIYEFFDRVSLSKLVKEVIHAKIT